MGDDSEILHVVDYISKKPTAAKSKYSNDGDSMLSPKN